MLGGVLLTVGLGQESGVGHHQKENCEDDGEHYLDGFHQNAGREGLLTCLMAMHSISMSQPGRHTGAWTMT